MRRQDKEISDPKLIDAIIGKALVCRIALYDGERPCIVPLSFGYEGKHIYLHSARDGKKIDILKQSPRVCFEFETDCEVLPAEQACDFTMRYRSVIGYGTASFIEGAPEKIRAVQTIMSHYTTRDFTFVESDVDKIVVIRIDIMEISGKQSGFRNAAGS
jgi:nitroimidazol reductase NimA-like FMN-containing flavoprotein (pyridoxamine 5'-phosphate oxidase superfamily)